MLYAYREGEKVLATPGMSAICPMCKTKVIAKCGEIVSRHWAHESLDCDPWSEPETAWHKEWKEMFPEESREVPFSGHRADILHNGMVIELQLSPISKEEIEERERTYRKMVWVVPSKIFADNMWHAWPDFSTFRWLWPKKSWWYANKPIIIDYKSDMLFVLKKVHPNTPCGGWGYWITRKEFMKRCSNLGFYSKPIGPSPASDMTRKLPPWLDACGVYKKEYYTRKGGYYVHGNLSVPRVVGEGSDEIILSAKNP